MMKTQNKKRGFTIIELVIVVTVIAILSAVLIPVFAGVIKNANLSADKANVRIINEKLAMADDDDLANLESVEEYLASHGLTIESYKPMSTNYKLGYSVALKKVVLVNAAGNIEFPSDCANKQVTVEYANADDVITELNTADDIALVAMSRGGKVAIPAAGLNLDTGIYLTKNTTVTLAGNITATADKVGDGVFCAKSGTLTLEGNGTVNAVGDNDYSMALWADGGKIVINGGVYTNEGAGEHDHYDLLYVKNGGIIEINGGEFKCQTPEWTLNSNDDPAKAGSIVIAGGKFYKFNPAALPANLANDDIKLAEGYTVRQDGDWYIVEKAA